MSKLVLWDFIQILKKRDDLSLPGKMGAYLNEYVYKVRKIVLRNYAFYKARHFEKSMKELTQKGELEEVPCNLCGSSDSINVGEKIRIHDCRVFEM